MKMMNFKCFVFLKLYKMMKKTLRIIFKKIEKKKKKNPNKYRSKS